jgi:hypothetical protein
MGGKSVIAFRALPGTVSPHAIHNVAGQIGKDQYDSHVSPGVIYVIRRACQALPCFLVHY